MPVASVSPVARKRPPVEMLILTFASGAAKLPLLRDAVKNHFSDNSLSTSLEVSRISSNVTALRQLYPPVW